MFLFAQNAVTVVQVENETSGFSGLFVGVYLLLYFLILILIITGLWKIFTKAGQAGWKVLIPIYNLYIMLKIIGRPGWWLLLFFVPFVSFVISIVVAIDLAKSFGKSTLFGVVGLWVFSVIGYLMLGFGSAEYKGPSAAPAGTSSAPVAQ